jgi:malate/lactate dehydrogenase
MSCFLKAKDASFDVIERKGHPGYSIVVGIVVIVKAFLRNENTLMTSSAQSLEC